MMARILTLVSAFVYLIAVPGLSAHAETTIVQNRDEPSRNVYQAHATFSSICTYNSCVATFPAIEPNRHVVAQFVSCWLIVPPGTSPVLVEPATSANANEHLYVPAIDQGTPLGQGSWLVSSPIVFYFSGGDKPTISVLFTTNLGLSPGDCMLTGYHVLLP